MKNLFYRLFLATFLVFSLVIFSQSFGQNLSLDELIKLRTMDLGEAEEFLITKNWKFVEATAPKEGYMGMVYFAYNVSSYNSKYAESFVSYYYDEDDSNYNRLLIKTFEQSIYTKYLEKIKQYNCKLINSKIEEGNIVKFYKGNTVTFRITISNEIDSSKKEYTMYEFFITNNEYQE